MSLYANKLQNRHAGGVAEMEQNACLFKNFSLSVTSGGNVGFIANDKFFVKCKVDNFSEQVSIQDDTGVDFFSYKYFTIDNSCFFEIKDCIQNGNLTTIFIQYVSNIRGIDGEVDNNFVIDSVTIDSLRKAGLDINELFSVLGNEVEITEMNQDGFIGDSDIFFHAIKLKLSEFPENTSYIMNNAGGYARSSVIKPLGVGSQLINQSFENYINSNDIEMANGFDNSKTAIIPIPSFSSVRLQQYPNIEKNITMYEFLNTLRIMLTDLVVSAELTIISRKSIGIKTSQTGVTQLTDFPIEKNEDGDIVLNYNSLSQIERVPILPLTRYPDELASVATNDSVICPVIYITTSKDSEERPLYGLIECSNFIKLNFTTAENKITFPVSLNFLNNDIDMSKCLNNYVYIKRNYKYLRVYIDYEKNIYQDIPTDFEYTQSAYSNYEAYSKGNLDLVQEQSLKQLQQQHAQEKRSNNINNILSGVSSVASGIGSFAYGNIAGGISSIVGGATDIFTKTYKQNIAQQNDIANLELKNQQARELLENLVVPTSEKRGDLSINNYIRANANGNNFIFTFRMIQISGKDTLINSIQRYIFDNTVTEKYYIRNQLNVPIWNIDNGLLQVKLKNKNRNNTRKDFLIWVKGT